MTLTLTVKTPGDAAAKGAEVELPAEVFDVSTNIALIHQVVVAQLAAARQGTHDTKRRGEVRGGGAKPYRQKGTGRARQGSNRAPQYAGGGVVHGPHPRSYDQRTPKKMKAAALRGALSDRARNDRLHVVSSLVSGDNPSTKAAAATLAELSNARHVLVVAERGDELTWKSLRNVASVHLIEPGQLNTYDVLVSDDIVFTEAALQSFLAGPAKGRSAKAAATSTEAEQIEAEQAEVKRAEVKPAKKAAKKTDEEKPADAGDFGPGSHLPLEDGSEPDGFPIKGNASSKLYHVPGSPFYERTVAEVWFESPEAAEAAGFLLPPSQRESKEK